MMAVKSSSPSAPRDRRAEFGSNSLTLAAIDNTHFRGIEFDGIEIEFPAGDGAPSGLTIVQEGNRVEFKRAGTK